MARYDLDIEIHPPRCPECRNDITYRAPRNLGNSLVSFFSGYKRYRCRYCENRFWSTKLLPALTRALFLLLAAFLVLGYLADEGLLTRDKTLAESAVAANQTSQPQQPTQAKALPAGQGGGETIGVEVRSTIPEAADRTDQTKTIAATTGHSALAESTTEPTTEPTAEPPSAATTEPVSQASVKETPIAKPKPRSSPLETIFFKTRSLKPGPEHQASLKQLIDITRSDPDISLSLIGFADNSPLSPKTKRKYKDNKGISKARAQAVADRLIALGLSADRLNVIGAGVAPKAKNADAARRVEIWLSPVSVTDGRVRPVS